MNSMKTMNTPENEPQANEAEPSLWRVILERFAVASIILALLRCAWIIFGLGMR